jgi:hypothetical protein
MVLPQLFIILYLFLLSFIDVVVSFCFSIILVPDIVFWSV